MESLCKQYLIILLLVATKSFAIAYDINNVANEQTPPLAKVLTSYLKVPWINLTSSWTEKVASTCRNDVEMLYESADAGEMWALKMLDSASKIPAGYLNGNIRDLGMYDECIQVKGNQNHADIQGRHCMVSLAMPFKSDGEYSMLLFMQKASIYNPTSDVDYSLTTSVCLPSSCGVEDVSGLVKASIQSTPDLAAFQVSVAQVTCSGVEIEDDLILGRILATSFFAMVASLLLFCTVCDFMVRAKSGDASPALKITAQFSPYTNAIKLLSTKTGPETLPAIHGIRFLNTCLVVLGHRVVINILFVPFVNTSALYELRQSVVGDFVQMLFYVVDAFFVLSGFLTARSFLEALRAGKKFNIFQLYLHRYLRLTPCVAVLILFSIFYLPYLGSGPLWETIIGVASDVCRKNWWTNLLYVQNFVNADQMCMLHTWYLAVEMQLFLLSPIILYPLFHRPKFGLAMLALFLIASFIAPGVQLAVNQWAAIFNHQKTIKESWYEFISFYPVTYNRALPYFIGTFLGYEVVNNKRLITKVQLIWYWVLACLLLIFSGLVTHFTQPNAPAFNVIWEVVYISVARLGFSVAVAWVLYVCTQGYGGLVTRFLSLPMFVPLSRMSYSIYLVHLVIQMGTAATVRTAAYVTPFDLFCMVWGDLVLSIAVAFILTLCFESPVVIFGRILKAKQFPPITKHASTTGNRELSAVIKEYLDLSRGPGTADLAVKRTKPQLNSRWNVSDVLNTSLVKGSPKTPAEWTKEWENWKSYLSRTESQRTTEDVENVQNGSPQLQIGIPTREDEFLIFLAGLSCGLGEAPNFAEPEILWQKSQFDSCSWQNEDFDRLGTSDSTPYGKQKRF